MAGKSSVSKNKNYRLRRSHHRYSMRTELSLILSAMILFALLVIGLAALFGLEPFYKYQKTIQLKKIWTSLDQTSAEYDDLEAEIGRFSEQHNINITLCDADFQLITSTSRNAENALVRLFGFYSGFFTDDIRIVEQHETYMIQESAEQKIRTTYLELWGMLDNGYWCYLQTPLQSMKSVARITLRFLMLIGIIVVLASTVLIWVTAKRYTEPITELSILSKRMAEQDFDARYSGNEQNEIGELGRNFNRMSDALEEAISELKSANTELLKDNERKTRVDEIRKEFLNNVSHELKTPIALIQGYAEGLREVADDPESRDFYTEVIIDEADKMNTMVRKLLTLNQLEFGNDPVHLERFDLTALTNGVISGMHIMIEEAGAEVLFHYKSPLPVWGDEFKIEEVLTNYLSNAVHHVGGEKIIEVNFDHIDKKHVRVTVFNTGQPIPESDLPHVFEKFYKVDKSRTREYGGSGIGLSIVRAIMEGHNQKCGACNLEQGVAFWFELELCGEDPE